MKQPTESAPTITDPDQAQRPEFLRLPRTGKRCPVTGLSRSMMNALILPTDENNHRPPVRSVVLRRPGNIRGVRLVDASSLLAYLRSQPEPKTA